MNKIDFNKWIEHERNLGIRGGIFKKPDNPVTKPVHKIDISKVLQLTKPFRDSAKPTEPAKPAEPVKPTQPAEPFKFGQHKFTPEMAEKQKQFKESPLYKELQQKSQTYWKGGTFYKNGMPTVSSKPV